MAYFPLSAGSDDRGAKGLVPLALQNMMVEPQPLGAGKASPFALVPTPGMIERVIPASGANLRGLYCKPGVRNGALFAVAGFTLYSISESWTATAIGTILGVDRVYMDAVGTNLAILASSNLFIWNGTTLSHVTDADFPPNAYTLASLADRLLSSEQGSDTFDWSSAGDGAVWPATGFAASARYPDEIRAQVEIGGDLFHFGATSIQHWRAVGGADSEAFDTLGAAIINRGIVGRDAICKMDATAIFVGDDRVVYELAGYSVQRIVNRDLETKLAALSEADAARIKCLSYLDGSHAYAVVKLPDGSAYGYDLLTQRWHRRTARGASFAIDHYSYFNGKHVVASASDDAVSTWEHGTYADAGTAIDRIATVHIPVAAIMPVSNITLDLKTFGQPLSGQGSAPKAYITFYRDGGSLDSLAQIGVEREVSLGGAGQYGKRPTAHRLGLVNAVDGLIAKIRISDPVGFAFSGVYVNELPI